MVHCMTTHAACRWSACQLSHPACRLCPALLTAALLPCCPGVQAQVAELTVENANLRRELERLEAQNNNLQVRPFSFRCCVLDCTPYLQPGAA